MISNTYTCAVENIHAPASAVERALREAKRRAAAPPPPQHINSRVIAAAASLVLVSAASATAYLYFDRAQPPITSHIAVGETQATQPQNDPEQPTETTKPSTAKAATETATEAAQSATDATTQPQNTADNHSPAPTAGSASKPTEAAAEKPTEKPTPHTGNTIPTPEEVQIDSSQLGRDGKLFFLIAPTAMNHIDDPAAFTDDHLLYIETKWGVVTVNEFKPLTLNVFEPYGHSTVSTPDSAAPDTETLSSPQAAVKYHYYYYNSDGTILYGGVVYR